MNALVALLSVGLLCLVGDIFAFHSSIKKGQDWLASLFGAHAVFSVLFIILVLISMLCGVNQ